MNRIDILEDKRMADLFAAVAESQKNDLRFKTNILALKVTIKSLNPDMDSNKSKYIKVLGFLDDLVNQGQ